MQLSRALYCNIIFPLKLQQKQRGFAVSSVWEQKIHTNCFIATLTYLLSFWLRQLWGPVFPVANLLLGPVFLVLVARQRWGPVFLFEIQLCWSVLLMNWNSVGLSFCFHSNSGGPVFMFELKLCATVVQVAWQLWGPVFPIAPQLLDPVFWLRGNS